MAAPPNTSAATAEPVTTVPSTVVLDVTEAPDQSVWYSFTATETRVLSIWAWADPDATTFRPWMVIYTGTPDNLSTFMYHLGFSTWPYYRPAILPAVTGTTYYINISDYPIGEPTNAILNLSFAYHTDDTSLDVGDLFINSDTSGHPATTQDPSDGTVKQFVMGFPYGEFADILPNGIMAYKAQDREYIDIYNPDLSLRASVKVFPGHWEDGDWYVDGDDPGYPRIRANGEHTFYLLNTDAYWGTVTVKTLSDDGVIGPTTWTLPGTAVHMGFAPSPDGTILYYTLYGNTIRRYDLVNSVDLGVWLTLDLTWILAYYDLVVLDDGSLLITTWDAMSPYGGIVYHYSAAGALLHTYDHRGSVEGGILNIDRIARDVTDETFWLWQHEWTLTGARIGWSHFYQIRISDGAVLTSFTVPDFKNGFGPQMTDATLQRWGPSYSCPLTILRQTVIETGSSSASSSASGSGSLSASLSPSRSASSSPSPAIPEIRPIRRQRQSPHLSDEQMWLYVSSFQLDLETGRGLSVGQGVDPQVMLQWSDDGGHTWSEEHWYSAGLQGAYRWRALWRRLGKSRDRVWRVTMSDPVPWRLLDAYVNVEKGTS